MVAVSDFSGLTNLACALASAPASAATDSLDRGMTDLHVHEIEADRTSLGSARADAMAKGFLGILRHQRLELALGPFVIEIGRTRATKAPNNLCPRIRAAHVDDPYGFNSGSWRLGIEQPGWLSGLNRSPKRLLGRDQHGLVQGIG